MVDVHAPLHPRARAERAARPRARVPARRRDARRARARRARARPRPSSRCCSPTPRSRSTTSCSRPTCPTTRTSPPSSCATSRRALRERFRDRLQRRTRCGARSSPRGVANEPGQPRRHDLRVPAAARRPAPAAPTSRAPTRGARGVRPARRLWTRSRRSTAAFRRRRRSRCSSRRAAGRARDALAAPQPPRPLDIAAASRALRAGAAALAEALPDAARRVRAEAGATRAEGSTEAACRRSSPGGWRTPSALLPTLDIVEVAAATEVHVEEAAGALLRARRQLELHWLRDRIALCRGRPAGRRWRARRCGTTSTPCTRA